MTLAGIRETVYIDFEFRGADGDRQHPVCMTAREHKSNRVFRIWLDDCPRKKPPFAVGPSVLVVAFFSSAEWGCYLSLGWELPKLAVDLYAEFRNATNGISVKNRGLVGALMYYGLDAIAADTKDALRTRILAGPPYSAEEQRVILDYCQSDVDALQRLFPKLIDGGKPLDQALYRAEYVKRIAEMEFKGVPIDQAFYDRMAEARPVLQRRAIDAVNKVVPVYEGGVFRQSLFEGWLEEQELTEEWPHTKTGKLSASDDTLKEMAALHPVVGPLHETRKFLNHLKKPGLTIGRDGRNRSLLSPYGTITGRNTPSGNRYIFGCSSYMRNLIRPEPGKALLYCDWSQQEFGIAAALGRDANMMAAYRSGDPYLDFAKQAQAVPAGATKESHPHERSLYKRAALATIYDQGPNGLALRIGVLRHEAQDLLHHHHRLFGKFWGWSDSVCDHAQLRSHLQAVFGWYLHYSESVTIRCLRNWAMQSNGSEMLRAACIMLAAAGVSVIAPVHDALLIECDDTDVEEIARVSQEMMARASAEVLAGFRLQTDAKIIRHGQRFPEERGTGIWQLLQDQLNIQ